MMSESVFKSLEPLRVVTHAKAKIWARSPTEVLLPHDAPAGDQKARGEQVAREDNNSREVARGSLSGDSRGGRALMAQEQQATSVKQRDMNGEEPSSPEVRQILGCRRCKPPRSVQNPDRSEMARLVAALV
jgi:hypothetical protein